MKPDPISPEAFRRKFSGSLTRAERAAQLCVKQPTSGAVHEARISIRKVMAAVSLMPREFRADRMTRKAIKRLRLFYKACAETRDIDTMVRTLSDRLTYGDVGSIIRDLSDRRSLLVASLVRSGDKVKELRMPHIGEVTEKRLRKRLSKVLLERAERAVKFYKAAAINESQLTDLHKLRKECRRIMYLLGYADQGGALKTLKAVLEDARTRLGSIRDDDLLLAVLRSAKQNAPIKLVEALSASRHAKYVRFFTGPRTETGGHLLMRLMRKLK